MTIIYGGHRLIVPFPFQLSMYTLNPTGSTILSPTGSPAQVSLPFVSKCSCEVASILSAAEGHMVAEQIAQHSEDSPSVMAMTSTGLRSCWERAGPSTRGCSTFLSRLVPRGVVPVNLICTSQQPHEFTGAGDHLGTAQL